jgi:hypothetical protein
MTASSAELNEDYEVCVALLEKDVVYNNQEQDCKDAQFWIDVPRDQSSFSGPGSTSSSPLFVQGYRSHGARSFNPNPNPPDTYTTSHIRSPQTPLPVPRSTSKIALQPPTRPPPPHSSAPPLNIASRRPITSSMGQCASHSYFGSLPG